jgi:hypothetical protein
MGACVRDGLGAVVSIEELALFGGKKTKTTPFGTGRRLCARELAEVTEAIQSDILFCVFGRGV